MMLGVNATWDDVQFLVKRFLYDSRYFKVSNPLRWDWKEPPNDTEDTHFESIDYNPPKPQVKRLTNSVPRNYDLETREVYAMHQKFHPYEEGQAQDFKKFIKKQSKSKQRSQSKKGMKKRTLSQMLNQKYHEIKTKRHEHSNSLALIFR
jgi:hypothetical protein